jgi:hypothetical protein
MVLAFRGECTVVVYRFYVFEKNDNVAEPPKIYELANDAAALEKAKRNIASYAIEIWRYRRKIARINRSDNFGAITVRFRL